MGKPPSQSEPYQPSKLDREQDMADNGVSPKYAKLAYVVIGLLLVVLFVLVMFGLHKPAGE